MVPASVRCTPSTRMSRTTKGSAAWAMDGLNVPMTTAKSATSACCAFGCRRRARKRARRSEQAGNVIEEGQGHQHGEHRHADALPDLERAVGHGAAFDYLRKIIQQMPTVQ